MRNERANVRPKSKRTPTQLVIQTLECEQKPQVINVEMWESDQKPIEVVVQTWMFRDCNIHIMCTQHSQYG